MAISKRSKLVNGGLGAIVVFAVACGGDDSGKKSGDAGTGGTSIPKDGAVGAACTSSDQCGGATCEQTQGIGGLSDILASFGFAKQNAPGGYCTTSCSADADCGGGSVCLGALGPIAKGECRKACTASTDCREGYECAVQQEIPTDAGLPSALTNLHLPSQCQAKPAAPMLTNQAGAPCTPSTDGGVSTECGAGTCGTDGACTASCSTSSDATCGEKGVCIGANFYGSAGLCEQSCTQDNECKRFKPNGTIGCIMSNGKQICGTKEFALAANAAGKACTADADCGSTGQCAAQLGLRQADAPGGYCTGGCTTDATCGAGGACLGVQLLGLGGCYKTCTASTDCREGYTCTAGNNAAGDNISYCTVTGANGGGNPDAGTQHTGTADAGVGDAG